MSKIEWTERTWNPVTGCTKISPGCAHCYAETIAKRFWKGRKFTDVQFHDDRLYAPLRWKKPCAVFVNSMSDLFHDDVPDDIVAMIFAVMGRARRHTFQVLTKRPERMRALLTSDDFLDLVDSCDSMILDDEDCPIGPGRGYDPLERRDDDERAISQSIQDKPFPNLWLGVSAENQKTAHERIPLLLSTPAAVRFISAEPLLGLMDLTEIKHTAEPGFFGDCLRWYHRGKCHEDDGVQYPALDWVIVGGESGQGARQCRLEWIQDITRQCGEAGVPCFVKQTGSRPTIGGKPFKVSGKGGQPDQWPEGLRVREMPE